MFMDALNCLGYATHLTRNLQTIFKAHPEFDETSTFVVSPFENQMTQFAPNDLLMSYWDLDKKGSSYTDDYYVPALKSYLLGLSSLAEQKSRLDVRQYSSRMSLTNLESRLRTSSSNYSSLG